MPAQRGSVAHSCSRSLRSAVVGVLRHRRRRVRAPRCGGRLTVGSSLDGRRQVGVPRQTYFRCAGICNRSPLGLRRHDCIPGSSDRASSCSDGAVRVARKLVEVSDDRAVDVVHVGPVEPALDPDLGQRLRHLRQARPHPRRPRRAVGRGAVQLSLIENGKREPKLSLLRRSPPPSASLSRAARPRAAEPAGRLEIELERAQRGPVYAALGLPRLRAGAATADRRARALVALHERAAPELRPSRATPE